MRFTRLSEIFKQLFKISVIPKAVLLCSCAVQIRDETLYFDAGDAGAVTANFLTPGSQIIPKLQWDAMREGMACVSAAAIGDFKTEIEELCSKTTYDYQTMVKLADFFKRINVNYSASY